MEKKTIVSNELLTEMKVSIARKYRDFLDRDRQEDWGLQVHEIPSMNTLRSSAPWKKWCANWMRRRTQINRYYNREIRTPEDFIQTQMHVLAPERLCFYLAAYTCIAADNEKEVVEDLRMRRKEVKGW